MTSQMTYVLMRLRGQYPAPTIWVHIEKYIMKTGTKLGVPFFRQPHGQGETIR